MTHALSDLVAQRVFGIACGYPDANDGDRLADDPIQKLLLDRHPVHGRPLASQPTVSRFENGAGPRALYAMGRELAATVIERHRRRLRGRARRITIDLTDDPTHGAQQLTFFHGHYDTWCYLPLLAFLTFEDEADQYLCAAVLRPGNAATATGARDLLKRLIVLLREAFPGVRVRVRLDGGFAHPTLLANLDTWRVERRDGLRGALVGDASSRHHQGRGRAPGGARSARQRALRHYQSPPDAAVDLRARVLWAGRDREPHQRTPLRPRDRSHQLLALLGQPAAGAAYRRGLRPDAGAAAPRRPYSLCARSGRERLLKIGARVVASARRFVVHLPCGFPDVRAWQTIARRLGATS